MVCWSKAALVLKSHCTYFFPKAVFSDISCSFEMVIQYLYHKNKKMENATNGDLIAFII